MRRCGGYPSDERGTKKFEDLATVSDEAFYRVVIDRILRALPFDENERESIIESMNKRGAKVRCSSGGLSL